MVLVTITLSASAEPTESSLLTDVVWSAAIPENRLEHVSIRVLPGRIHLGMFIRAASADEALPTAHHIWRRAAANSPLLRSREILAPVSLRAIGITE